MSGETALPNLRTWINLRDPTLGGEVRKCDLIDDFVAVNERT